MGTTLLVLAALLSLGGAISHGYVGGKIYMGNVKGSNLLPLTQSLSLISWQMFTVFLVTSGVTLLCVAMNPDLALLSYPVLLGNGMGAALFLWIGLTGHARLFKLPGMYLMLLTAVLGWLGLPS